MSQKIRNLLDDPDRFRVKTQADTFGLDLSGCIVDSVEISAAVAQGVATLSAEQLTTLSAMFAGEFLDGWRRTAAQHSRPG